MRGIRILALLAVVPFLTAGTAAEPSFKFFDDHSTVALIGRLRSDITEPALLIHRNGVVVDDPNTPGMDLFNVIDINDRAPGTPGFPTTWADIIANTFVRPTHQDPDDPEGSTGTLGTSVVGSSSYRTPGGTPADFHFVPTVIRADVTTGLPTGERIAVELTANFDAMASVTSRRTFPDPPLGETTTGLSVTFEALQAISLDPNQLGNDAFRLLTVSSMLASPDVYDANVLRYEDPNQVAHTIRLADRFGTPDPFGDLFPAPVELGTWFELVNEPGSLHTPDNSSIRVEFDPNDFPGTLGVQGFLFDDPSSAADSLSVWIEWIDAPAVIAAGTILSMPFTLIATPEPVCGDLSGDKAVGPDDIAALRSHLADSVGTGLSGEQLARCSVISAPNSCNILDLVVIWRHVFGRGPGLTQACAS